MKTVVAHPSRNLYSETFIRAHIRLLPGEVAELSGGLPPAWADGKPLVKTDPLSKALRRLLGVAAGKPRGHFHAQALAKYLRETGTDVVLAEYGPTGVSLLRPCAEAGVPLVVHFHGYDAYESGALERYREGYERLFAEAAAIIAVSRDMCAQLESLGAERAKIRYNPCGADTAAFAEARPGDSPPVFLAVGRFTEKKAPGFTVRAFAAAHRACPEARLVMIGEGPLLEECKGLAAGLGIADAVEFAGVKPHAEIAARVSKARAFVQHSVRAANGDSEGTPVSVMEAAAAGLPVVATAHAGIKDVVEDGITGFLVAEGDVEAMGSALARLALNASLAAEMGSAARRRLKPEFKLENSVASLGAILKEVARRA